MTKEEYIKLFHKEQLNLVAFKRLLDCDEEVLRLVNKAIEKEREACAECGADGGHALYCVACAEKYVSKGARMTEEERSELCSNYGGFCKKEWVGLTDEEILKNQDIVESSYSLDLIEFARDIEAKLKERNT